MTRHSKNSESKAVFLRRDAENRLRLGSAPSGSDLPLNQEALRLLYAMASDPERSSDALRLLQELQVHQVELDLQREELENNERELTREVLLYKTLMQMTPAACLIMSMTGHILDSNPAFASILGAGQDELPGKTLQEFLTPDSQVVWSGLLRRIADGQDAEIRAMVLELSNRARLTLDISANHSSGGEMVLLVAGYPELFLHDHRTQH